MTRASLLRILDHVNGISDDEIRELEQLAAAFPYCQTAHVLLAKTAHDRGSMLAGQRLRRAATYAADRELLRQLLERPAPLTLATEAIAPHPTVAPVAADTSRDEAVSAAEMVPVARAVAVAATVAAPKQPEADLFAVEIVAAPALADEMVAPEPTAATGEFPEPHEPAAEPAVAEPVATAATTSVGLPDAVAPTDGIEPPSAEAVAGPKTTLATSSIIAEVEEVTGARDAVAEQAAAPIATAPEASGELLPAVAPPIRPPSSAGISRFEFGLGESRLPEPTGYRLPEIEEEDEEFDPEDAALPTLRAPKPPRITAPFRADAELGYALGGGSRLGYDLQARTPAGFVLDLPLEAFFEPDALLLAHARTHQPAPKTSSLDLINRFLKAQPRIKTGTIGAPQPTTEQADLSARNNAAAPVPASESLAKIMVRQGKTAKAIEIYERLMAKQPEKMAYFAEQIQQLQQPPE